MKCPYCKAEISDDSQFCGNCGKKIPNKVKSSSKLIKMVVACVVVCVLIGGGWYVGSRFFFKNEVFPTFDSFIAFLKKASQSSLSLKNNCAPEEASV